MTLFWGILIGLVLALAGLIFGSRLLGFAAQRPADYAARAGMDIRQVLAGDLLVDGVLYGPLGRVVSRFTATMDCQWQGNHLVIDELFEFDSGMEQRRRWELELGDDGQLRGGAGDIFGAIGTVAGDTLSMRYRLRLPESAGGHMLAAQDWMYRLNNGTLVNRSQMRKFGFKVAELVATIRPVATTQTAAETRRAS